MTTHPAATSGIAVRGLAKRYGVITALRGIDLEVRPGERLAVLGPNGSGKTTLLRILAGLTRPTKGSFTIGDMSYGRSGQDLRARIGFVAHHPYLYEDLTAEENLMFYGRMFDVAQPERRARAALEGAGIAHRRRDRVRTLSRGMQQRVALARAILHDPDLLLMDEPDTGLDQEASALLGDYLLKESGGRRTVVLATHNLALGLRTCDRFIVLAKGRVAHEASMAGLDLESLEGLYRSHASGA